MNKLYSSLFIIFIAFQGFSLDDPIIKVAGLVRQAKAHGLTALMAENVEISVPGDENTYTKAQAETVLTNFFNQNKPISVKVLHKVNSNPNFRFGVLLMSTGKNVYRIALIDRTED